MSEAQLHEEAGKGPYNPPFPIKCEECMDVEHVVEVHARELDQLRKLESLRREEEARMAERFDQIISNQKGMSAGIESNRLTIMEVRDIALKNSHDLNNGLKSQVSQIRKAVVRNAKQISAVDNEVENHLLTAPTDKELYHLVERVLNQQKEKESTKKMRTMEVGVGAMVGIVTLQQFGFFDWVVSLFGG